MDPGKMFSPLLVFLLAMCIHEALCIKCWECLSEYDDSCNDPFDNRTIPLTDCSFKAVPSQLPAGAHSMICRKTRQEVNGQVKIFRGCGFSNDSLSGNIGERQMSCFVHTAAHNILMEYCTCDTDGCNYT